LHIWLHNQIIVNYQHKMELTYNRYITVIKICIFSIITDKHTEHTNEKKYQYHFIA